VAYRTSKFVSRHRIVVAAAAVALLSLIAGLGATLVQIRTARRERVKAEAISAFLQKTLIASDPAGSGAQRSVKELLDDASKRLAAKELADQPELKAELQTIIGQSYLSLGEYDRADQNLAEALATQVRLFGNDDAKSLKTLAVQASLWGGARGNYARADEFYRGKLPLLRGAQKRGTLSAEHLIQALSSYALLQRAGGDSRAAETLLEEAAALRSQTFPETRNNPDEALLALTRADQGKFAQAVRSVRDKVAAMRRDGGAETPELCASLTGLGSFLIEEGAPAEAEENLRAAEAIYRKLFSASNMQLGDNLRLQAQALLALREYAEAEAKINAALEIYRAASSPQYVNYATALMVQGIIFSRTGRGAEAEKLLREAVQLRTANVPETHFLRAAANGALGEFLGQEKRFGEGEPLLLASYESLKKSQAPGSPRTKLALERLANLYREWGRPDVARGYQEQLAAGRF